MRVANAAVACVSYLGKMLVPSELAVYYPHLRDTLPVWQVAAAVGVLLGVSALAVGLVRRAPYLLVGWLWYLGTLVPVLGIVQVGNQAMADRYTYIPLVGVFLALTWGVSDLLACLPSRELVLAPITTVVLGCCLLLTWSQVSFWRNSFTLWQHTLDVTTDNALAHTSLAGSYEFRGDAREALAHYQKALRIDPYLLLAHRNLGNLLLSLGESEEAFKHFAEAARLDPYQALPHDGMGLALLYRGEVDAAVLQFNEALRIHPGDEFAFNGLGDVWMYRGRPEMAITDYRRAVERAPAVAQYHCNLASALHDCNQREEARREYDLATWLAPTWSQTAVRQAWKLATHAEARFRNGRLAVQLARQVVQARDPEEPEDLDVLAAAYAEAHRFEEAIAAQRQALKLMPSSTPPELTKERESRLQLYEKHQPFHEGYNASLPSSVP
jgi:tetratricopeptide (TPR) repeat protein